MSQCQSHVVCSDKDVSPDAQRQRRRRRWWMHSRPCTTRVSAAAQHAIGGGRARRQQPTAPKRCLTKACSQAPRSLLIRVPAQRLGSHRLRIDRVTPKVGFMRDSSTQGRRARGCHFSRHVRWRVVDLEDDVAGRLGDGDHGLGVNLEREVDLHRAGAGCCSRAKFWRQAGFRCCLPEIAPCALSCLVLRGVASAPLVGGLARLLLAYYSVLLPRTIRR